VGFRRKLAFSGLAACACLSGTLHAQSIYFIPIPDSGTAAKFELYVTYSSTDDAFNHAAALEFIVPAGAPYPVRGCTPVAKLQSFAHHGNQRHKS
jgi:hypothetical protein